MAIDESTFVRLVVLVQRLSDADLVTEAQCRMLTEESAAALSDWRAGHFATALDHVRRVDLETTSLVTSGAIEVEDARDLVDITRVIQADDPLMGAFHEESKPC